MKILDRLLAHIFPPLLRTKWVKPDVWFDRELLEQVKPMIVFKEFGIKRPMVTGTKIVFRRYTP